MSIQYVLFISLLNALDLMKKYRRNMTWNGLQGFRTPIEPDSFVVDNIGTFGTSHQERGLTCT